jgi:hypothetical protein
VGKFEGEKSEMPDPQNITSLLLERILFHAVL